MAVTYDEYKKKFDAIKASVLKFAEEIGKNERYMGQTTGVIQEGVKEVGLRVQELKDGGMVGTTIDKFSGDAEVAKMLTSIKGYLAGLQKELVKAAALEADVKKTVKAFQTAKTELATEIATRKKQVSTKVGTGNKSLPDMEKLLAEMKKYTDETPYVKVEVFVAEKYDEHFKETTAGLAKECTQAKAAALSAFQLQMQEQALNVRVLGGNFNTAKGWYDIVIKQCEAGQKAAAAGKNKELMTAKATLVKPWNDLKAMSDSYQNALKDQWIGSKIRTSKDKGKIEQGVKGILDMKTKAGLEVTKIANAKVSEAEETEGEA